MNIKGFSEAEKMRKKSLIYKKKIKKRRKKDIELKKQKAIKIIQADISKSVRNGYLNSTSFIDSVDVYEIKQYIFDYFSTRGYKVSIDIYGLMHISWEE